MSESNYPLSATLKARSDSKWDAPWVVIYGHTPDEVADKLDAVANGRLIDSLVAADNALKAASNAAAIMPKGQEAQAAPQPQAQPQQSAWGQQPQAAPANNGAPTNGTPHPEGKQCQQCGTVLQFKQVSRKTDGRTFKFWSCPNGRSKGDGHSSEFAN